MKKPSNNIFQGKNGFVPIIVCGCGLLGVLIAALIIFAATRILGGNNSSSGSGNYSQAVGEEVEFLITTYNPASGGMNGNDCGGAAGSVCSDPNSPTGYTVTTDSGDVYSGGVAVPQDSENHSGATVDIAEIPIPLYHDNSKDFRTGLVIPGYNNEKPVPVVDHFATSITAPNAIDVAASPDAAKAMGKYWEDNNLRLGTGNNGLSQASRVKCKIVLIGAGGGGGGGTAGLEFAFLDWVKKGLRII